MGVFSTQLILLILFYNHFGFGKTDDVITQTTTSANVSQPCSPNYPQSCNCTPNLKWNSAKQTCDAISCDLEISGDCDEYHDPNRVCRKWNATEAAYCLCKDGYISNRTTFLCEQNKTEETALNPYYNCSSNYWCRENGDTNLICVDSRCKCAPNYIWSDDLQHCLRSKCKTSKNCKIFDRNRICHKIESKCVCKQNYYEHPDTKQCLINVSVIPYQYCDSTFYCDFDQLCIDNRCECEPNYRYNKTTKSCEYRDCTLNTDCSLHDPNRVCRYGSGCQCKYGYERDSISRLCVSQSTTVDPIIDFATLNPIIFGCFCGSNQHCVDNECECIDGYAYEYKEDSSSFQCVSNSKASSGTLWWVWLIAAFAIGFIGVMIRVSRRESDADQALSRNTRTQNHATLSHSDVTVNVTPTVTLNDSPPPYSRY